jgi:sulfite oxidase
MVSMLRSIEVTICTKIFCRRNWDLHVTSSAHRIKVYSINRKKPDTAKRLALLEEKGVSILPITLPLPIDLETDDEYIQAMAAKHGRDPED